MVKKVMVTTICDNCGQVNTSEEEFYHELPDFPPRYGNIYARNYSGAPPDYCPDCHEAVKVAIESALEARKGLHATQKGETTKWSQQ